jgi:SAM-dependent methyltransferase
MAAVKDVEVSGRDHYNQIYKDQLDAEAEWLRICAKEKARSIQLLLSRNAIKPRTLLELGCGTGAVITECKRLGLASEFHAIDYSREAIQYVESRQLGIHCAVADITDPNFELKQRFDTVVLSHVVEHLEEPLQFLQTVIRRIPFRYLIVEVPLENMWLSRALWRFRSSVLRANRKSNRAGHVQFFSRKAAGELLSDASLVLKDDRAYLGTLSLEELDFLSRKNGWSGLMALRKKATGHYLQKYLEPLWKRSYYAHYAVLCEPPVGKL